MARIWEELIESQRAEEVARIQRKQERDIKAGKEHIRLTPEQIVFGFKTRIFKISRKYL